MDGSAVMEFIASLFDTSDFPRRWECGNWTTPHGLTHIISDFAIFGAYAAIPVALGYFISKRKDTPFLPVFWLFAAFIMSCGVGHLVEAIIFWHPWYRVSAVVKATTAIVSWATVIVLIPAVPKALALPGLAVVNQQLQQTNDELERFANVVTGREGRIIELKKEVNQLLLEAGEEPRYLKGVES